MAKKQLNIRLPDNSFKQLTDLQSKLGMTQVQVVMLALDRLATQEQKKEGTQMFQTFQIGEYVVTEKGIGIVEAFHDTYPDWYWVRFLKPLENAPFADEFPANATHNFYLGSELTKAEGDDFVEPPTVGNEAI